jgi:CheY-like chemotaxis protein
METLRASAVAKAHAGVTTYEEVLRVTQLDSASGVHCSACGGAISGDMVACPWCTTPIDRGHCTGCSRPLEAGWRICPWCRTDAPHGAVAAAAVADGPPRVLLIDDNAAIRSYVTSTLAGTVEVDAVGSASEGLDRATRGGYDGVLVDYALPDLPGADVVRLLRSEARTAALPVLLLSDAGAVVEAEARNAGADDHLVKPIDPVLLEERVWALVGRSARLPL